jgi:GntR family transcriptional regulator, gluconate operon transcriptional repressor
LLPLDQVSTLSSRTTDLLRERIVAGDFRLGERLVESRIAQQLQISRGPVRDALKQLRAEGLVREEPRRGFFIVDLTAEDLREIYELRAAIEGRAARLVILRRDLEAIDELREILRRLRRATDENDRTSFTRLDLAFHEKLCLLSGNSKLHRVFVGYAAVLGMLFKLEVDKIYTSQDSLESLWEDHRALFEAIESLEVKLAEEACDEHLSRARERLIQEFGRSLTAGGGSSPSEPPPPDATPGGEGQGR